MSIATKTDPLAPNAEDENGEYWDPWDALGVRCGGYSSAIDDDALAVLKAIRDGAASRHSGGEFTNYTTDIAAKTGMSATHVELWQYLFCSADWCDYGTSPRGCFPNYDIDFDALIAAWEAYYERRWKRD